MKYQAFSSCERLKAVFAKVLLLVAMTGLAVRSSQAAPTQLDITAVNGGTPPTYGAPFAVTVEAQDGGGMPDNVASDTEVSLSVGSGSGSLGGVFTGVITNGTSSVTISGVAYSQADTSVILVASRVSGDSLTDGDSDTFDVNPATLTIASGLTADDKVYDGDTDATISSNNVVLSGVVSGDESNVSLSTNGYTASFDNANASNAKTVMVGALTLTGSAAGNYTLTQPTLSADITGAEVSIVSGVSTEDKIYDRTTAATLSSNVVVLVGVILSDESNVYLVTNGYTANFDDANVGNFKTVTVVGFTLGGTAAGNYTLTQPALTADIAEATVTISSGLTADDKVYDGDTDATISSNNVVLSGVVSGDESNVSLSTNGYTASFDNANASNAKTVTVGALTLTGSAAGNYTLTQPTLSADISKAPVNVTLDDLTQTYDRQAKTVVASTAPVGGLTVDITYDGSPIAPTNVGSYEVIGVVSEINYEGAATNALVIEPATLTVTNLEANDKVYDGNTNATINAGEAVLGGVYAGDVVTLVTNGYQASFSSKQAEMLKDVTVVGMGLAGADSGNYMLAQPVFLIADITPKGLVVVGVEALDKIYDGSTAADVVYTNASLLGVVSGDDVSLNTTAASGDFESDTAEPNKTVTVTGLALAGADADNYRISADPTALAEIYGQFRQTSHASYSVGNGPRAAYLANLRGLGTYRDLCVASYSDDTVSVRLCLDNGVFSPTVYTHSVGSHPVAIASGELLGTNPYHDLVTANNGTNTISVLVNQVGGVIFDPRQDYQVSSSPNPGPAALMVIDVNSDNRQDVVVANYNENTVSVLTNQGGALFANYRTYPVGNNPTALFVVNLDGQPGPEIVTANRTPGTLSLLKGSASGVYSAAQTIIQFGQDGFSSQPVDVKGGDINGDGVPDLVVANYASNTVSVLLGVVISGDWHIASRTDLPVGLHPQSILLRDINRDGHPDIACLDRGDQTLHVFYGAGNGSFTLEAVYGVGGDPVAIAGSNFNSDNATDIAIVDASGNQVFVYMFAGPLANNHTLNVYEDVPTNIELLGSLLSGGTLTYEIVAPPVYGTLSGSGSSPLYTPAADFFGDDTFTYHTIDDLTGLVSADATVTLHVLSVNDQPAFTMATNVITTIEDSPLTSIPDFITDISPGPYNESGQAFSFIVSVTNTAFFSIKPAINSSGILKFKPKANVVGTTTVTARVKDSGGTMRGGVNLSAPQDLTFVILPNPLKPLRGYFYGLYAPTNGVIDHVGSGYFTFKMKASGAFSGKLSGSTGKYPFTGQFDLTGHAQSTVARNGTTLYIDWQLDLTNGTERVTGTVTDNQTVYSSLVGDRLIYSATTNPAPLAGTYTMAIPGSNDAAAGPGGDSYATITIQSSGIVRAVGKLSDGTLISQSAGMSKYNHWPFYQLLLAGDGSVFGSLIYTNLPATAIDGVVTWIRPVTASAFYSAGFTNNSSVIGSAYTPPGGVRVLDTATNLFIVSGGNLGGAVTNNSTLSIGNAVSVNNTTVLTLSSSTSGLMSGSFLHPTLLKSKMLQGVALQQQNVARGYFLGTNQSGAFLLQPND